MRARALARSLSVSKYAAGSVPPQIRYPIPYASAVVPESRAVRPLGVAGRVLELPTVTAINSTSPDTVPVGTGTLNVPPVDLLSPTLEVFRRAIATRAPCRHRTESPGQPPSRSALRHTPYRW